MAPIFNKNNKDIKYLDTAKFDITLDRYINDTLQETLNQIILIEDEIINYDTNQIYNNLIKNIIYKLRLYLGADCASIMYYDREENCFKILAQTGKIIKSIMDNKIQKKYGNYSYNRIKQTEDGIFELEDIIHRCTEKMKEDKLLDDSFGIIGLYKIQIDKFTSGVLIFTYLKGNEDRCLSINYLDKMCSYLAINIKNWIKCKRIYNEKKKYAEINEHLMKFVDISTNIVCTWDLKGNITYNNNQISKVLGYSSISKLNLFEMIHSNKRSKLKLQQAKLIDEIREKFLTNITHEFRTPINIIQGTVQLIETGLDNSTYSIEKLYKHIKYLKRNSNRLLRLVNNLIDITYIKNGYHELDLKNYNIVEVAEDVCNSVILSKENRGINLVFDTNSEEKIIACDEDEIARILLNLISNAVKYSSKGEEIRVELNVEEDVVKISVKDKGIGISKENLDTIFDNLTRIDNNMTRENEGSGIGLAIVKSLVNLHDGSIKVDSELRKGSNFEITLPVRYIEDEDSVEDKRFLTFRNKIEKCDIEFSDIYCYN